MKDLTNKKFGRLIALYPLPERRNKYVVWHCKCDCGNEKDIIGIDLSSGNTKSCGCLNKETRLKNIQKYNIEQRQIKEKDSKIWKLTKKELEDKIGYTISKEKYQEILNLEFLPVTRNGTNYTFQKIGKLFILGKAPSLRVSGGTKAKWWYICDCDKHTIGATYSSSIRNGVVKSCGCLAAEKARIRMSNTIAKDYIDLKGQHFGYLEAIEPTEKRSGNAIIWKCLCHNHKQPRKCEVSGACLRNGNTKSCGCLKSQGELEIINLLTKNNIEFKTEYSFPTCVFPESQKLAKFDFFVEGKYLIEFDGEQHFKPSKFFNNVSFEDSFKSFKQTQYRDNFKNEWCKKNNIPLIRIPYTLKGKIKIENLLLESSEYII